MEFLALLVAVAFSMVLVAAGQAIERRWPAVPTGNGQLPINLTLLSAYLASRAVIGATVGPLAIEATHRLTGGGLLKLPAAGPGYVLTIVCSFLALDLGEYAVHRLLHRIPALWAIHSLHHSDREMNISTTGRHHWLVPAFSMLVVAPVVAAFVDIPPQVAGFYGLIAMVWSYVAHLNVRIDFGRWNAVITSPALHRVHHSVRPEDYDCNFAAVFPIFDVILGTYKPPKAGEWSPTGLEDQAPPRNSLEAVTWPLRLRPEATPPIIRR